MHKFNNMLSPEILTYSPPSKFDKFQNTIRRGMRRMVYFFDIPYGMATEVCLRYEWYNLYRISETTFKYFGAPLAGTLGMLMALIGYSLRAELTLFGKLYFAIFPILSVVFLMFPFNWEKPPVGYCRFGLKG